MEAKDHGPDGACPVDPTAAVFSWKQRAEAAELQIDALKKEEQDTRNQYTALKHSAASRISELEEDLGRANENVSLLLGKLRDQLDGIVKDWGEAFAKHGFILHPGLTPEQNAAEWAAKVQKKDRLNGELTEAKGNLLDFIGCVRTWAIGQPTAKSIQESCLAILEKYALKRKCPRCGRDADRSDTPCNECYDESFEGLQS